MARSDKRAGLTSLVAGLGLGLGLLGALPGAAWAEACDDVHAQAQELLAGQETEALKDLYDASKEQGVCTGTYMNDFGQRVAGALVSEVMTSLNADQTLTQVEGRLIESLAYGRRWQALALLGDLHNEREEFGSAGVRYQEALVVIKDVELTPSPPQKEVIAGIWKKAEQTGLLASSYVQTPKSRDGEPGGLADVNVRGFIPTRVALPVEFEYDSTLFTAKGRAAAADMADFLTAEQANNIHLIGHTDPKGEMTYNDGLSLRRAQALRNFLAQNGFSGQVTVDGRGEREPMEVDDAGRYSQGQLYQIHRRVELERR